MLILSLSYYPDVQPLQLYTSSLYTVTHTETECVEGVGYGNPESMPVKVEIRNPARNPEAKKWKSGSRKPRRGQTSWKSSLSKSFVDCCIAPTMVSSDEVEYKIYSGHKHGTMNKNLFAPALWPEQHELGSLGEAVNVMDIQTRNDAQDDLDEGSSESSSDSEADDE